MNEGALNSGVRDADTKELLGQIRIQFTRLGESIQALEVRLREVESFLKEEPGMEIDEGEKRSDIPAQPGRRTGKPGLRHYGLSTAAGDPLKRLVRDSDLEKVSSLENGRIIPFIESPDEDTGFGSEEVIEKYREEFRNKSEHGEIFPSKNKSESFEDIFERYSDSLTLSSRGKFRKEKASTNGKEIDAESLASDSDDQQSDSVIDRIESEEVFEFPALGLSELERPDLVSEEEKSPLYNEIKRYVSQTIQLAALEKPLVLGLGQTLVDKMLESIQTDSQLLSDSLDRRQNFTVSGHSVNVTVLAIKLACSLNKSRSFCIRVGLAGLLHEVGVVKLPEQLLHKESPLTPAELQLLRERPLLSSEVLRSVDRDFGYLPGIVAQVLERRNGSGYPLALLEGDIKPESAILGIADFFEAFVHKRPYRRVLTGYQAFREMTRDESQRFAPAYVRGLIEALSLFPYGEVVLLSDGRLAEVIEINRNDLSRPIVKILESGRTTDCPTLNLTEGSLRITRAVSAESLDSF
jgi:HD-GYP domain-containing protein (c-di-GMP phosphodiesterase class II)